MEVSIHLGLIPSKKTKGPTRIRGQLLFEEEELTIAFPEAKYWLSFERKKLDFYKHVGVGPRLMYFTLMLDISR